MAVDRDRTVRIAVIGDEGVGKSSLVTAASTECFSENPPPVLPPSKLPPESTPEGVPIVITDTSSRPEDRPALETAVAAAQVLVLAFDCTRPDTLERCGSYWMREVRRLGVNVPVVLVGCKSDLRSPDAEPTELHQAVLGIVSSHKQIEICLECSSRNLQFVGEVFYYALKSVVNPIGPLFDAENGTLKPLCVRALKRVFNACDRDKDKVLNDAELNAFQLHCFNAPLAPEEVAAVKKVVAEKLPQGVTSSGGLTFPGFLFLHALFIERGRTETPWQVLRRYGYDNFLKLSDAVLDAVSFKRGADQVVELTEAGIEFFSGVFERFDRDNDGLLSKPELEEMFSTAPGSPWTGRAFERLLVEAGHGGALTREGFVSKWVYTTALDPRKALAYVHYLGHEGDPAPLFSVSRPRRQERRSDSGRRGVYQGFVFGAPGAGKTSLLLGLAGLPAAGTGGANAKEGSYVAVGRIQAEGGSRWLILREMDEPASARLMGSESRSEELAAADVSAFVFDSSSEGSFEVAAALMVEVGMAAGDALPCVFVAAKDDLGMSQDLVRRVGEACAGLKLRIPVNVSMRVGETGSVYGHLLDAAVHPALAIPETPSLKAARRYRRMLRRVVLYTAAGTITAGGVYFLYKLYHKPSTGTSRSTADTTGSTASSSQQ